MKASALFQSSTEEIRKLIDFEDFTLLTKRLIDFTLDTGQPEFYRKTLRLLEESERSALSTDKKKVRFSSLLTELESFLKNKLPDSQEDDLLLSVYNLIRTYKKSSFALGPLGLELHAGEIIGLVGENGNGKTTLLRSLCGELQATNGEINYRFPYKDTYDLRSKLIYIPQRTPSWHGSLLSNLRFTAACYGIYGEENLLTVELVIARMGLRKYRTYKWRELSSGYKMRFELARALLRKPCLLLIDEPLANLDILAQQIVLDDFRDIARSPFRPLGIVLSSQQLYEVEKASDQVIFLKNGQTLNPLPDTDAAFVEIARFIVEFETDRSQEQLREMLKGLSLEKLQLNGGTYVACFPERVSLNDFLKFTLENEIQLRYFRDISRSTRRFFLS